MNLFTADKKKLEQKIDLTDFFIRFLSGVKWMFKNNKNPICHPHFTANWKRSVKSMPQTFWCSLPGSSAKYSLFLSSLPCVWVNVCPSKLTIRKSIISQDPDIAKIFTCKTHITLCLEVFFHLCEDRSGKLYRGKLLPDDSSSFFLLFQPALFHTHMNILSRCLKG